MGPKKTKGTATAVPLGVLWGAIISMLMTVISALILTWLTLNEITNQQKLGYCIMGSLLCAAILGSFVSTTLVKRRKLLICLMTGLTYYITLLGITALFFGGNFQGAAVKGLLIAAGSLFIGMLQLIKRRHNENAYERYRTR
jgi:putative membrane protein (TIGR04086 family)